MYSDQFACVIPAACATNGFWLMPRAATRVLAALPSEQANQGDCLRAVQVPCRAVWTAVTAPVSCRAVPTCRIRMGEGLGQGSVARDAYPTCQARFSAAAPRLAPTSLAPDRVEFRRK